MKEFAFVFTDNNCDLGYISNIPTVFCKGRDYWDAFVRLKYDFSTNV